MSGNDHVLFSVGPSTDYDGRARSAVCVCGYETAGVSTIERLLEAWSSHVTLAMCEQLTGIVNGWAADMVRQR